MSNYRTELKQVNKQTETHVHFSGGLGPQSKTKVSNWFKIQLYNNLAGIVSTSEVKSASFLALQYQTIALSMPLPELFIVYRRRLR